MIEYNYRFKVAKLFIKRRDFMNLEKLFHLKENHTDVRTEVMAGITTFMTMAYILAVNPSILSASGMEVVRCSRQPPLRLRLQLCLWQYFPTIRSYWHPAWD